MRSNLNRSQTQLEDERRRFEEKKRGSRSASAGPGISNEAADALEKELRELKRKGDIFLFVRFKIFILGWVFFFLNLARSDQSY